jgi:hypothetical protein
MVYNPTQHPEQGIGASEPNRKVARIFVSAKPLEFTDRVRRPPAPFEISFAGLNQPNFEAIRKLQELDLYRRQCLLEVF